MRGAEICEAFFGYCKENRYLMAQRLTTQQTAETMFFGHKSGKKHCPTDMPEHAHRHVMTWALGRKDAPPQPNDKCVRCVLINLRNSVFR